jgi:hypothetical protein
VNAKYLPTFDNAKTYLLTFAVLGALYVVWKAYSASTTAGDAVVNAVSHPFDTVTNWYNKNFGPTTAPVPAPVVTNNPDGSRTVTAYNAKDAAPPDWLGGGPPAPPTGSTTTQYPDTGGNIPYPGTDPNGETVAP